MTLSKPQRKGPKGGVIETGTQTYSNTSNSSASPSSSSITYFISSPSSASDCSNSSSLTAHAGHSSSSSEDFRSLKDRLLEQWPYPSSGSLPAYSLGSGGLFTHDEVGPDRTIFGSLSIQPPWFILKKTIHLPNCLWSPCGAFWKPWCLSQQLLCPIASCSHPTCHLPHLSWPLYGIVH